MQLNKLWHRKIDGELSGISIDPSGNFVACASIDGHVQLLSRTNQLVWDGNLSRQPLTIACDVGGQHVGLLSEEGEVVIVDKLGQQAISTPIRFQSDCLALRPESTAMALANRYRLFRIAKRDGKILRRGEVSHPVDFISYSPKGSYILLASAAGNCSILLASGSSFRSFNIGVDISGIAISSGAAKVAASTLKHGIVIVDTESLTTSVYREGDEIQSAAIAADLSSVLYLKIDQSLVHLDLIENEAAKIPVPEGCCLLAGSSSLSSFVIYSKPDIEDGELYWYQLMNIAGEPDRSKPPKEIHSQKTKISNSSTIDYVELD